MQTPVEIFPMDRAPRREAVQPEPVTQSHAEDDGNKASVASPPTVGPASANSLSRSSKHKCYANRHMTMQEYALWDICRKLAHKKGGSFHFDGQAIAQYFETTGKDIIYRTAKSLEQRGWLVMTRTARSKHTGWFNSTICRPLSVDEWGAAKPHVCNPLDSPTIRGSANGPFAYARTTIRKMGHNRSQYRVQPFAPARNVMIQALLIQAKSVRKKEKRRLRRSLFLSLLKTATPLRGQRRGKGQENIRRPDGM